MRHTAREQGGHPNCVTCIGLLCDPRLASASIKSSEKPLAQLRVQRCKLIFLPGIAGRFGQCGRVDRFVGERFTRSALVGLLGRVEYLFALVFVRFGPIADARRILQRSLKSLPSLRNQPAAKVFEPVIGAAAIDDLGDGPQIPAIQFRQHVLHVLGKGDDFVRLGSQEEIGQGRRNLENVGRVCARLIDQIPESAAFHCALPG